MSSAPYCCLPLFKRGVFRQIFVLFPVTNFTKIRPVGTALIHADRQADRPEEANSMFSLFVSVQGFAGLSTAYSPHRTYAHTPKVMLQHHHN
jgi:hypothetical protein